VKKRPSFDSVLNLANSELDSNSAANGGNLGINTKDGFQEIEAVISRVYNCNTSKSTVSAGADMYLLDTCHDTVQ